MVLLDTMHPLHKFLYCPCCGSDQFYVATVKSKKCGNCGFERFMNPSSAFVAFIRDSQGRILVVRRGEEPAKGTLDLPGGFADIGETAEEGIAREVMEETNLTVTSTRYLFSLPNTYHYSGIDIPTLDMFFECSVKNTDPLKAMDDAAECMWIAPADIVAEEFGLHSIRKGVEKMLQEERL